MCPGWPGVVGVSGGRWLSQHIVHGQSNAMAAGGLPAITLTADLSDRAKMFGRGTHTWSSLNNPTAPASRTGSFALVKLDPSVSTYEILLVALIKGLCLRTPSGALHAATYAGTGAKRLAELSSLDLGTAPSKGFWPTLLDDMDRMKARAIEIGRRYRLDTFGIVSCESDQDFIINPGESASTGELARDTVSSRLRMMWREAGEKAVALGSPLPKCWAVQPAVSQTNYATISQAVLNAVDPAWVDPVESEPAIANSVCIGPHYAYDSAINSYFGATRYPEDFTGYTGLSNPDKIHHTAQSQRLLGAKAEQAMRVMAATGERINCYADQITDDPDFPGDRTRCLIWIKIYAPPLVLDTTYFPQFFSHGVVAYPNDTYGSITSAQTVTSISVYDDGRGETLNGVSGAVAGIAKLKVRFTGSALPADSRVMIGRYSNVTTNPAFTFASQVDGPLRRTKATYDYTFTDGSGVLFALATALIKRTAFQMTKASGTGPSSIFVQEVVSNGAGETTLRGEQDVGGEITASATYNPLYPTAGTNFRDSDATDMGIDWVDTWYGDQTLIGTRMPAYNWLCCGELLWA